MDPYHFTALVAGLVAIVLGLYLWKRSPWK
jgi:hypothetical protein